MLKEFDLTSFRWAELILNISGKNGNTNELSSGYSCEKIKNVLINFDIDSYTGEDKKVLEKFKKELENNKNINKNEKNEEYEYLKVFLQNYCYFVRCSFFHGGKNDAKYTLFKVSNYDKELELINEYLSCLVSEFLNIFGKVKNT